MTGTLEPSAPSIIPNPCASIFFTIPIILSVLPAQPCSCSASRSGIGWARGFSIDCYFPVAALAECKIWGAIHGSMSDQQLTGTKQWLRKRRSQRIELTVPVVVHRPPKEGPQFSERAQTLVVNAHGALMALAEKVTPSKVSSCKTYTSGNRMS